MNISVQGERQALMTVEQKTLPRLIKQSATYKLFVPKKVEEKIRYLCRKFPALEWSGILFTTHRGNFEDGSLEIHCEDIYPMDLGSGTFTSFKMDESVAGYIAENIELFGCDMNLVHSHNQMAAFLSGTDISTLQSEGNDQNCFVSLIVNNAGTYCAAITRKMQRKTEIITRNLGKSYEFFGEGAISDDLYNEESKEVTDTIIEYFMLDVQVEQVENPLAYLDTRFDEIQDKKQKLNTIQASTATTLTVPTNPKWSKDGALMSTKIGEDEEFYDWMHSERKKSAEAKEALLFDESEMGDIDVSKWVPSPVVIHHMVCQMITGSLIVNKDIDLKQWITRHMERKYNELFPEGTMFTEWKDFIIEFLISYYPIHADVPAELLEDNGLWYSKIAEALLDDLGEYPTNSYIEEYNEALLQYIILEEEYVN